MILSRISIIPDWYSVVFDMVVLGLWLLGEVARRNVVRVALRAKVRTQERRVRAPAFKQRPGSRVRRGFRREHRFSANAFLTYYSFGARGKRFGFRRVHLFGV